MAKLSKAAITERDEAIEKLRGWIKPGDTVYTVLDHVSSSGMSRAIRVVLPYVVEECDTCHTTAERSPALIAARGRVCGRDLIGGDECAGIIRSRVDHLHPNWAVGKALGLHHWRRNGHEQDALVVGGCGMDMGFHIVYNLARTLYRDGYPCIGKDCPSNDHSNGDRDYTPGHVTHADGGYMLRHRWL